MGVQFHAWILQMVDLDMSRVDCRGFFLSNICEYTGNGCAESHEGNGIDGILKENEAAQVTGNVTDNSSANTNHGNGNDEARVTVGNACHIGPK